MSTTSEPGHRVESATLERRRHDCRKRENVARNVNLFNFEGADVRVVVIDGEPWFVAKDVAGVLGYSNPLDAIAKHCKAVVKDGFAERDSIGLMQKTPIIPERDVYRLVMKSHLPAAERFEEWVVGDVLPSIRKTGGNPLCEDTP